MRNPIKVAFVALGLIGGAFAVSQPAMADNVSVTVVPRRRRFRI
jgi:hypothetical protein